MEIIKASLKYAETIIKELDNEGIKTGEIKTDIRNNCFTVEVDRYPVNNKKLLKTDWEAV